MRFADSSAWPFEPTPPSGQHPHAPDGSLARLLNVFRHALLVNRGHPLAITTAEQWGMRMRNYREDFDPENARLKTVRRPK